VVKKECLVQQIKIIYGTTIVPDLSWNDITRNYNDVIPVEIKILTIIKRNFGTAQCLEHLFDIAANSICFERMYWTAKWDEVDVRFLDDAEVMRFVLTYSPQHPVSKELRSDKALMLHAIKKSVWTVFAELPDYLKRDRDIIIQALKTDAPTLYHYLQVYYMLDEFKDDREFLELGLKYEKALAYASDELRDDYNIVLKAVRINGMALEFASKRLQGDRDIVIAALSTFASTSLRFVSPELRSDRDIVMRAVSYYGENLRYASPELKNDYEIVVAAIEPATNGNAILYASDNLMKDKRLLIRAIRNGFTDLAGIDPDLLNDKDLIEEMRNYEEQYY